jgi:transposase
MELDFTGPPLRAKTLEEAQEIINGLWVRYRTMSSRVEALEERVRTNSRNSSKPPSSDIAGGKKKDKRRRSKSRRKAGGQPGHVGKSRALLPPEAVDQVKVCYPRRTCDCGRLVTFGGLYRRHQMHELPEVKPVVIEYRLMEGSCDGCGKAYAASLPAGVGASLLGPRAMALVGTLTGAYRLSRRLTQGLLRNVYGLKLSLGAISETEAVVSAALLSVTEEAKDHVRQAAVAHCDETGHKEKGEKRWMWVAIAAFVSVFLTSVSRSAAVAKALLGEAFAGILVSDRGSAYTWVKAARRQLCWAHLIRDFTKISERSGEAGRIGDALLGLSKRMFKYWRRVKDGAMTRERFQRRMKAIRSGAEATLAQGAACNESKTRNTCKKLLKLKCALWTFVDAPAVEPTNNLAERTLRAYVIFRKICLGSQSARGSLYLERIMTTVGSCQLQGRDILGFLTQAVRAHLGEGPPPSLLPVQQAIP